MPGFNGTGPMGDGPRSGRGMGNCRGNYGQRADYPGRGYGMGRGGSGMGRGRGFFCRPRFGFGFGRGWGAGVNAGRGWGAGNSKQELKEYQDYLEEEMKAVREELNRDE